MYPKKVKAPFNLQHIILDTLSINIAKYIDIRLALYSKITNKI